MEIDEKLLERLSDLSRLSIAPDNKPALPRELNAIVSYFDILDGVAPIPGSVGSVPDAADALSLSLREDVCLPSFKARDILQNAPDKSGDMFIIPKAVD